jgi:predicted ArsR family transcriptional regulator
MDRTAAVRLAIRCARDSMPPLRLAIIDDLAANPDSSTQQVRKRLDKPRNTADRQLQALHMLGVVTVREQEYSEEGRSRWFYSLAEGIDPSALNAESFPEMSVNTLSPSRRGGEKAEESGIGTDISGKHWESP